MPLICVVVVLSLEPFVEGAKLPAEELAEGEALELPFALAMPPVPERPSEGA